MCLGFTYPGGNRYIKAILVSLTFLCDSEAIIEECKDTHNIENKIISKYVRKIMWQKKIVHKFFPSTFICMGIFHYGNI